MNNKTVKIVNIKQASLYMKHGLKPLKVYWNVNRVVYEFNRKETNELFVLWCDHKLN